MEKMYGRTAKKTATGGKSNADTNLPEQVFGMSGSRNFRNHLRNAIIWQILNVGTSTHSKFREGLRPGATVYPQVCRRNISKCEFQNDASLQL